MQRPEIACRDIREADIPDVVDLFSRGFPEHPKDFWAAGLARLAGRLEAPGYPKIGVALTASGRIVGAILTIFSRCETGENAEAYIRCNLSTWFVEPAYSAYAAFLSSSATRRREATYLNVSAAPHTHPIVEALGFRRLSEGLFIAAPLLSPRAAGARVVPFDRSEAMPRRLSETERAVMEAHARLGCLSLLCEKNGEIHPFVFYESRRFGDRAPGLHLGYCRDIASFVACAGELGRAVWRRGPLISVDADGPIASLRGWYRARPSKYYKGPVKPRLGDLAYVEDAFLH